MSNGDIDQDNLSDIDNAASDSDNDSDSSIQSDTNESRDESYNTINSLDALKEIISKNTNGTDNLWFKHYFLRHVNRLPSRHQYQGRRLSQCREEDEGNDDGKSTPDETASGTRNSKESKQLSTQEISGIKSKKPLSLVELFKNPKSLQTSDIISPPRSRATSPRVDRYFFDSSLVEMKSQASSTSTIEYDSGEEVWVKRTLDNLSCNGSKLELTSHSGGLPTIVTEDVDTSGNPRQRSGTWSQSRSGRITPPIVKSNYKDKRKGGDDSGPSSECQSPKKSSGSVFDAIRPRSKSDAGSKPLKRGANIITHVKNAVQNSLMSSGAKTNHSSGASIGSDNKDISSSGSKKHEEGGGPGWSGLSSRPRADSDSSNSTKGAVNKVMDMFRHRSQSAVSAEDKRKARAAAIHQQQIAAQSALLRRSSLDPDRRRLSLGTVASSYRGSSDLLDLHHAVNAAVLFRDSRGLPVATSFLDKIDVADLEKDGGSRIFVKFFKWHKCYDLIPTSAKLVVFDTQLLVKKAFFALVYNGIRAAPLWDSVHQQYVGMLTITDFIKILQMYYTSSSITMEELEEHKLETWREVLKEEEKPLVSIGPDKSLFDAIRNLIEYKIHRLPVIDEMGNVLYILTHKRILRFLFLYINDLPKPSFLNRTLRDLKIGTYENVETVAEETSIIHALRKFLERRVSALPMTDSEGHLVDIFAKFDVINLAAEKTYTNLDVTLKEANEHKTDWFEGVEKCLLDETLFTVMERIVRAEVHRLVVVDEEDHVLGVLSLSDILVYLVLRPSEEEHATPTPTTCTDEVSSDTEVPTGDPDASSDKVFIETPTSTEEEDSRDYVSSSHWGGEVPVSV